MPVTICCFRELSNRCDVYSFIVISVFSWFISTLASHEHLKFLQSIVSFASYILTEFCSLFVFRRSCSASFPSTREALSYRIGQCSLFMFTGLVLEFYEFLFLHPV